MLSCRVGEREKKNWRKKRRRVERVTGDRESDQKQEKKRSRKVERGACAVFQPRVVVVLFVLLKLVCLLFK